ncbi:MAG: LEA/WHy family protein [Planctomycetota bacterium]|jgi:LEA14-like dessication related protein
MVRSCIRRGRRLAARRIGAALVIVGLGGCETLGTLADAAPRPDARIVGASLEGLSPDAVTLAFDVEVSNPYSVALPLADLDYALSSRGHQLMSGEAALDGSIPARDARVVPIPVQVSVPSVLASLETARPGSVIPYDAELGLSLTPPGTDPIRVPLRHAGELPLPTLPRVELVRVGWQRLTFDEAAAELMVRVTNDNEFPVDLSSLGLSLALSDQPIVTTTMAETTAFAAGGAQELRIPISFSPRSLGLAVFNMLSSAEAAYELRGRMALDTPFGGMDLPYVSRGRASFDR